MTTCMRSFVRTIRLVVNQLTVPMMEFHERVNFYFLLCCVRLSYVINRDVRYTVMILFIICQLVCVTDLWVHMSFVLSILSLKLGVIEYHDGGDGMVMIKVLELGKEEREKQNGHKDRAILVW